jgi:PTH2 family peptidyl-tRNA hydrolase
MKQVIAVRTDLKMGKGKLAAQVAHASLSAYELCKKQSPKQVEKWENEGQKKVILKVSSKEELFLLFEQIKKVVPAVLIFDAGKTQLEKDTPTCFGAGPAEDEIIDKFTSHLKLL